ncbi:MAG: hypothetical protein KIS84_11160 [Dokdonella sp.]|nr:hypothetical protein [Dokdonella sp.]
MSTERVTIVAQLAITVLVVLGFFGMLALVTLGRAKLDPAQIRLADTMVGVLGTILTQIVAYWFARQRNAVAQPEVA